MLFPRPEEKDLAVKRFGYLLSLAAMVIANVGIVNEWPSTPIWFLVTMYLLLGSMWMPQLIRPFYRWFGHYIVKPDDISDKKPPDDLFNRN
ncbi:MAG TPA: hypothetical protein ENJ10_14230 [Caldithrix abyssi]|uniref:Uncharacterized protein n=1 Tax=Caldithrix abyssi TaxID=187145 RepID=A0A7V1LPP4_CALAY|nr:hypothetical protein [Caldithrix abyssi]